MLESTPLNGNNKRLRRSWVWDHFKEGENKVVTCKVCDKVIKWNGESPTQLAWHLNSKHKIYEDIKQPKRLNWDLNEEKKSLS